MADCIAHGPPHSKLLESRFLTIIFWQPANYALNHSLAASRIATRVKAHSTLPSKQNNTERLRIAEDTSAASGYVCPVDDAAESFVVGVVVAPDDVPADHAGPLLVTGVVGAVEREVP
jgi:hypothetical protein